MTMTAGSTSGGAVYDRGYRPYEGPVGGRWAARWAVFRLTARRALGIRRSWRQRVLPWSLLALATVPAVVNVGIRFATRDTPVDEQEIEFISYSDYLEMSMVLLLFVAVTAPDALCPDRRNRVLPLVFSRPLTGADYALSKLGALTALVFGFAFFPQVVLFVGQTFVHQDGALDYIGENAEILWQVPLAVTILAGYLAAVSVALSSLTSRRIVGGVAILGLALVSGAVASVLVFAATDRGVHERETSSGYVETPPHQEQEVVPQGPASSIDRVDPRRPEPGGPVGQEEVPPFEDPLEQQGEWPPEEPGGRSQPSTTIYVDTVPPDFEEQWDLENERDIEDDPDYENGSAFALIDVFNVPLYLRDVVFDGHIDPLSELGGVSGGAVAALVLYLVVVALSVAVLLWRYREVQL